jgi:FkbM family methyltransferase
MGALSLPAPPEDIVIRRLRGYPLSLKFKSATYQGRFLYYRGIYEERVIRELAKRLSPSMTFVDVGANVGLYTVIAGHLLSRGRVIAIEPQPDLCSILRENVALNQLSNVKVHECALGQESHRADLFQVSRTNDGQATLKPGGGQTFGSIAVSVRAPKEIIDGPIQGMKIDVEGGELDVLRGFADVFQRGVPSFIFLECIEAHLQRFGDSTEDLLEFLRDFGFSVRCLYRWRWREIRSISDHARYGFSPDLLASQTGLRTAVRSRF